MAEAAVRTHASFEASLRSAPQDEGVVGADCVWANWPTAGAALRGLAALLCLASAASAADGGRYGPVEVVAPASPAKGLTILFSDKDGLQAKDRARLNALANAGAIAVGVDTRTYLDNLAKAKPGCLALFEDAEPLSRALQREHPTPQYRVPLVVGEGLGGTVASRVVAGAPLQTVGGAVAVDPVAEFPLARDLCPRPLEADDREGAGTPEAPVLKNPWTVALTPTASAEARARWAALAEKTRLMRVVELRDAADPLGFADLVRPFLAPERPQSVADLPLVEMRASAPTRRLAVFLSGDGGWRDVDKRVSEKLQSMGVSVVGWDSLRYFWSRKTPDQVAADVAAVIAAYQAKWGCDEVALIGFSFGADAMPFVYARLDPALRAHIAQISLMSPGEAADWEIKVTGWFGAGPSAAATPLAPAAADMPGERLQCFYGVKDAGNSCKLFGARGADMFEKPGDHHMDGDYDLIGRQIAEGFARRAQGR